MMNFIKKIFGFKIKYQPHPEAVVISCFFNPQNSPYRLKAFNLFYESIKHTNHRILECVIGDAKPQLPENENIKRVYTENLLWHKEALLNKLIAEFLKPEFKYIFWVDADVLFTNENWILEGVDRLKSCNIIQPFEYCVHLGKNETEPSFDLDEHKANVFRDSYQNRRVWRSFCANFKTAHLNNEQRENYNIHGHVGFAWGARREILKKMPLYDRALIGGADHIIAHAAVGQIPHSCITKSFTDNLEEVLGWSKKFYKIVGGKIDYVNGDLYHIWHGDINKRQYLKRIQDFTETTKQITHKDANGLYITHRGDDAYMKNYFKHREVTHDDSFLHAMALDYIIDSNLGDSSNSPSQEFGGGTSGGGGAGGSWEESRQDTDNITAASQYTNTEHFS